MVMIVVDGSYGEGGGQILRSSLTLSTITKKPFIIKNIRKGREKPGIMHQHLSVSRAIRKISRGDLEGDFIGSQELKFIPGKIVGGKYNFKIGTAGSVVLLAQAIIPILLFSNKLSSITIEGGTDVCNAPCYYYFEEIFLSALNLMGIRVSSSLIKTGYYPKGGGIIKLKTYPNSDFSFPKIFPREEVIKGKIKISGLPFHIALREKKIFVENEIENVKIEEEKGKETIGNVVFLKKGFKGVCCVGKKGKRAEILAKECLDFINNESYEIDRFLADQLMIYAALSSLKSRSKISYRSVITPHIISNAYVISKFLEVSIELKDNSIEFNPL